ncbi:hypothetical protein OEZ85_000424 [Tetradesmus obliquus]|uniref:AP2/ERF domain-containing protein n=1 Tax=Tetradesmus obliquus TaxID=3088 RepID=A0ABY8UR66_TETOB|nr:hypothetical protein OEZ85_000424 [Tetradesmus obliquus]
MAALFQQAAPDLAPPAVAENAVMINGWGIGVSQEVKPDGICYKTRVCYKGKARFLGRFPDVVVARLAYDAAIRELRPRAKTNYAANVMKLEDASVLSKVRALVRKLLAEHGPADAAAAGSASEDDADEPAAAAVAPPAMQPPLQAAAAAAAQFAFQEQQLPGLDSGMTDFAALLGGVAPPEDDFLLGEPGGFMDLFSQAPAGQEQQQAQPAQQQQQAAHHAAAAAPAAAAAAAAFAAPGGGLERSHSSLSGSSDSQGNSTSSGGQEIPQQQQQQQAPYPGGAPAAAAAAAAAAGAQTAARHGSAVAAGRAAFAGAAGQGCAAPPPPSIAGASSVADVHAFIRSSVAQLLQLMVALMHRCNGRCALSDLTSWLAQVRRQHSAEAESNNGQPLPGSASAMALLRELMGHIARGMVAGGRSQRCAPLLAECGGALALVEGALEALLGLGAALGGAGPGPALPAGVLAGWLAGLQHKAAGGAAAEAAVRDVFAALVAGLAPSGGLAAAWRPACPGEWR